MKRVLLIVAAIIVLLLFWFFRPLVREAAMERELRARLTAAQSEALAKTKNTNAQPANAAGRSPLADALNSPATDIRADLRLVSDILETFRSNFPRIGNPVGNNAEITAALTGNNKLRLTLIPPDHPAINQDGELCDRWGTPFFFHAESGTKMEIRSAGPDKKMWTDDDVMFAP